MISSSTSREKHKHLQESKRAASNFRGGRPSKVIVSGAKREGGGGVSTTMIFRLVSYLILAILQDSSPYDLDLFHGSVLSIRLDEPQPSHDAHTALDASKDGMFPI